MNNHDYEKARQECWDVLYNELLKGEVQWQPVSRKEIFNYAFDRAYALGKEKEAITEGDIERASVEYSTKTAGQYEVCNSEFVQEIMVAFEQGANFALGKQEKKKLSLTDKEVYALESAISELESLMDGTLDEDYHKGQKIVINTLKRIIKKYEKK